MKRFMHQAAGVLWWGGEVVASIGYFLHSITRPEEHT